MADSLDSVSAGSNDSPTGATAETLRSNLLEAYNELLARPSLLSIMGFTDQDLDRWRNKADSTRYSVCSQVLRRFVQSKFFSTIVVVLITANAVVMGVTFDSHVRFQFRSFKNREMGLPPGVEETFLYDVDFAFTIIFAVELILRLIALELSFFVGAENRWNLLDFMLVAASI